MASVNPIVVTPRAMRPFVPARGFSRDVPRISPSGDLISDTLASVTSTVQTAVQDTMRPLIQSEIVPAVTASIRASLGDPAFAQQVGQSIVREALSNPAQIQGWVRDAGASAGAAAASGIRPGVVVGVAVSALVLGALTYRIIAGPAK